MNKPTIGRVKIRDDGLVHLQLNGSPHMGRAEWEVFDGELKLVITTKTIWHPSDEKESANG